MGVDIKCQLKTKPAGGFVISGLSFCLTLIKISLPGYNPVLKEKRLIHADWH